MIESKQEIIHLDRNIAERALCGSNEASAGVEFPRFVEVVTHGSKELSRDNNAVVLLIPKGALLPIFKTFQLAIEFFLRHVQVIGFFTTIMRHYCSHIIKPSVSIHSTGVFQTELLYLEHL